MTLEILNIFNYTQAALSALIVFFVLLNFKSRQVTIRLIGLLFFIGFAADTISLTFYFLKIRLYVNVPQSLYNIGAVLIISSIYYYALKRKNRRWFIFVSVMYTIFFLFNLLYLQKTSINSYSKWLSGFIVISYALIYFYWLMKELPATHLQRMPMFWINSAFLIYYSGSLLLFAFTDYLVNVLKSDLIAYWSFHNILSIIEHLIILVGLWYDWRGLKTKAS